MNSEALAGWVKLRPGPLPGGQPNVQLTRPELAGRLLTGIAPAQVPQRLAAVFALCASAQAFTARQALAAAAAGPGQPPPTATPADRQALRLATAREQLLRIVHDWPRALGADAETAPQPPTDAPGQAQAPAAAATTAPDAAALLAACPLWRIGLADEQRLPLLAPWLARHVSGLPPATWLAALQAAPATWPADWCEATATPTARLLRRWRPRAQGCATPGALLQWPADATLALQALAGRIAHEPGFARQPLWQGAPADTGPWSRRQAAAAGAGAAAAAFSATAWQRLVSRLADLMHLAEDADARWLAHGAFSPAPQQGLAWTETARGLLLHWVALQGPAAAPQVAHYRVISPTEWNCHPQGGLARALQALRPGDEAGTRLLALAYDPCVPLRLGAAGAPSPQPAEVPHA